jgi:glycosyltransferase involved in cell wall biosynthesis
MTIEQPPPLVSVIMAAFNAAAHIEAACRSALDQTYANLELIVVDDGSTDDTAAIVSRLSNADRRIRLIRQKNRGIAAARNTAVDAARGEYLAPLDADDLWDTRKVALQVARMLERGPRTGLVYCWWVSIDVTDHVLDGSPRWDLEGRAARQLVDVNFTGNASVPLFRRSVVVALGAYDTSMHEAGSQGCEDWDLAIRTAETQEVAVVPQVLVAYRRRADGMSASRDIMWRSLNHLLATLVARQPDISPAALRRSRGQFALYLAGVSWWAGDRIGACRWVLRTRSFTLLLAVAPPVARLLVTRLMHDRGHREPATLTGGCFADDPLPQPLIPYAAIYRRYWNS